MAQINGRQKNGNVPGGSPLEQLLGRKVFSSTYFTDNFEQYSKWLSHQNLVTLHKHSMEVMGEMVKGDRTKVIQRLEQAFKRYHSQIAAWEKHHNTARPVSEPSEKTIDDILRKGGK